MSPRKAAKKTTDALKTKIASAVATISEKAPASNQVKQQVKESVQAPSAFVVIDHPVQNEKLYPPHYAMRLGASDGIAEIQINNSSWMPCRHTAGYWWFDWVNFAPGKYKITARIKNSDDKVLAKSSIVKVEVL
ncbi:MAG: hypothetical protein LHV68_11265 [Elusimicrobia bacterium]|nr:hypothetical protein [Candidatus Liberimonas magnetica]